MQDTLQEISNVKFLLDKKVRKHFKGVVICKILRNADSAGSLPVVLMNTIMGCINIDLCKGKNKRAWEKDQHFRYGHWKILLFNEWMVRSSIKTLEAGKALMKHKQMQD